jgi:hypothetical protein
MSTNRTTRPMSTRRQRLIAALDAELTKMSIHEPEAYEAMMLLLDRMVRRAGGARTLKKFSPNASRYDFSKGRRA